MAALLRSWWLIVGCVLVGGLVAFAASLATPPTYTSEVRLFVSTTDGAPTNAVFQSSQFSEQRVTSYAELLTDDELAARVIDRLDLADTPDELAERVTATATPNSVLIDLSVTDSSPEMAQELARALSLEFIDLVAEVETPDNGESSPVKVSAIGSANLPDDPSSPRPVRYVAVGIFLGLLVGVTAAIARVRLDRTVKDPEEAAAIAGAPVIGTVVRDEGLAKRHVLDRGSAARAAEDYRQLRTNLQFLNVDTPPQVIMVTSAMPSEGKTTLVLNLAMALAEAGRRVVVVDADLRRPRVTSYLGMVGGVGLTNVLSGQADVAEVVQEHSEAGISVLGAGPTPPNPSELLSSSHMVALIAELREKHDYVLVDAPPLLPVADATGLAVMVDGAVLSVRYGESRKDQLKRSADSVRQVGARVLGVVLNIVPPKAEISSAYGYGYSYGSEDNSRR